MRLRTLFLLLLLFAPLPLATHGQEVVEGEVPMPDVLVYPSFSSTPVFVSAERAVTPEGEIDGSYFHSGDLAFLRDSLDRPDDKEGCLRISKSSASDRSPEGHDSLTSAARGSDNVIVAKVIGRLHGFSGPTPGTLLRLETEEVLSGAARDHQYLFFPVGDFSFAGRRICSSNPKRPRSAPDLGDRLLVLFDDYWWNDRYDLVRPNGATGAIPLPADRGIVLPPAFLAKDGAWQGKPPSELVDWVRGLLIPRKGEPSLTTP